VLISQNLFPKQKHRSAFKSKKWLLAGHMGLIHQSKDRTCNIIAKTIVSIRAPKRFYNNNIEGSSMSILNDSGLKEYVSFEIMTIRIFQQS